MLMVTIKSLFHFYAVLLFYMIGGFLIVFSYKAINALKEKDFKRLPFFIVCAILADLFSVMVG